MKGRRTSLRLENHVLGLAERVDLRPHAVHVCIHHVVQ